MHTDEALEMCGRNLRTSDQHAWLSDDIVRCMKCMRICIANIIRPRIRYIHHDGISGCARKWWRNMAAFLYSRRIRYISWNVMACGTFVLGTCIDDESTCKYPSLSRFTVEERIPIRQSSSHYTSNLRRNNNVSAQPNNRVNAVRPSKHGRNFQRNFHCMNAYRTCAHQVNINSNFAPAVGCECE